MALWVDSRREEVSIVVLEVALKEVGVIREVASELNREVSQS